MLQLWEKRGHISKYCQINKRLNELSIDEETLYQLNDIMAAIDDDSSSKDFLEKVGLQINEIETSSESKEKNYSPKELTPKINVLTNEEEFLLETTNNILDPETKKQYVDRL